MKLNSVKKYIEKSLDELGFIRTGHHFREKIEPCQSGNVQLVQTKDFSADGGLDVGSLTSTTLDGFKKELALRAGDIVLRARGGSSFPAAVVPQISFITLPVFPILLIRTQDARALPEYVAWYLNQPKTQQALQSEAMGTFIPTVSKSALASLKIPLPSLAVQKDIVTLSNLVKEESRLLQEISTRRQGMTNKLLVQYAEEGRLSERMAYGLKGPDSVTVPPEPSLQ